MKSEDTKSKTLPKGIHPGFAGLPEQPNVHRCKLWPHANKANPDYADYKGLLHLSDGSKAFVMLWCHEDGTLGLRLEMLRKRKPPPPDGDGHAAKRDGGDVDAAYERAKAKLAARNK
jgi:hypothetical protein